MVTGKRRHPGALFKICHGQSTENFELTTFVAIRDALTILLLFGIRHLF